MRTAVGSRVVVGRWSLSLPMLPGRKQWTMIVIGALVVAMLTIGLSQIFRVNFDGSTSTASDVPELQWRDMIGVLTRYDVRPWDGNENIGLDVLLATPHYFGALRRQVPAAATEEPSLLFYVTETTHVEDLPDGLPDPLLKVGPNFYPPASVDMMADSYHHRTTVVRYATEGIDFDSGFELFFPAPEGVQVDDTTVGWTLPLQYSDEYASSEVALGENGSGALVPAVSGVAVLAVLGGLLAAMWPCLFQLTAYFIPAMAGMSMQDASKAEGLRPRVGVVRIAFFFVLGFTIVYTLAGAVLGFGSQQLSNMESFYVWQRYLSIGAGVILFGMALRVAARARTPLVCKMPIISRKADSGITSPWESMLVGITFATGCMTCFGSAVLIGMVLYVGLAGSPVVGATLLFLFSLGMGIPLVAGAMAMAKVLPTLFKIEKAIPWMGLASALIIAGYAVLLITGNFMGVTGFVYRLTGVSAPGF